MRNEVPIELTQAELQVLIFALRLDLETVSNLVSATDFTAAERNEHTLMTELFSKLCSYIEKTKV